MKGGDSIKKYTTSSEEVKELLKDGYRIVSIAYFVSNPVLSFILEK